MRYAISGDCTDSLAEVTTGRQLLGKEITAGRVFWLRSAHLYNISAAAVIEFYDITQAGTIGTEKKRLSVPCASGRLTIVDLPAPGLKFSTGCVVRMEATVGDTGSFDSGDFGGAGYEEG